MFGKGEMNVVNHTLIKARPPFTVVSLTDTTKGWLVDAKIDQEWECGRRLSL